MYFADDYVQFIITRYLFKGKKQNVVSHARRTENNNCISLAF